MFRNTLFGLLALASVSACASYKGASREVSAATLAEQPGWVRIEHVELVRQRGIKDCGSAALATVLGYLQPGGPATLRREAIDAALREEPGRGLAASQLRDYARRQGFDSFVIQGAVQDLEHEVEAGRPVIVGVNKPLSSGKALAHYEVFVGFNPKRQEVLTLDPARGLRRFELDGFVEEWEGSGHVAIVVMPKEPAGSALRRPFSASALALAWEP
jgi:ABC-type bacteriocin/lantibiotic exporter with double-glycine peptidase domain